MFPALYHHADDTTELRLFSSPDGIVWSEVPGDPVLTPGPPGAWDGGCVFGGLDLVPLAGDRMALPYSGYLYPHKYPRNRVTMRSRIAYAQWPAGRLGALEAVEDGSFTTLPLVFDGSRLSLNLQTKHAGHVLVEAADRQGRPLPGRSFADADPISGDHLDRPVTWNGEAGLAKSPGQPVLLRFRLRAAKLFGLQPALSTAQGSRGVQRGSPSGTGVWGRSPQLPRAGERESKKPYLVASMPVRTDFAKSSHRVSSEAEPLAGGVGCLSPTIPCQGGWVGI